MATTSLALKALEQQFAGKIKSIYIDPPYNTGSAFEHYDDGVEHSQWLNLMKPRLDILKNLLSNDGSIWISIDDNEVHYLKVLCDEIFGRANFDANVVMAKKDFILTRDERYWSVHDHILVYSKNRYSNKLLINCEIRLKSERILKIQIMTLAVMVSMITLHKIQQLANLIFIINYSTPSRVKI